MAEKKTLADKLAEAVNKKFKTDDIDFDTAFTLDEIFTPDQMGYIPTGNMAVDYVLGKPGFPVGRMTELAGPYGSGKSTIVARTIAQAQKAGITCILLDTEFSYSASWGRMHGIDPKNLVLIHPLHLQDVFDKMLFLMDDIGSQEKGNPIFMAVDSMSIATAEEMEAEDSTAGKQRGQHASVISQGIRKIQGRAYRNNVAVVFISQLKDNPGIMFGTNKSKLGGHAVEFHGGILLEVKRSTYLKTGDAAKPHGMTVRVEAKKNKFVEPFRNRTFDIFFGEEGGIRPKEILLEFLANPLDDIKKSGGWFEYDGSKYHKADLAIKLDDKVLKNAYVKLGIDGGVK